MANRILQQTGYHEYNDALSVINVRVPYEMAAEFTYTFENFFHPFVGELIAKLDKGTLKDLLEGQLDPALRKDFFQSFYTPNPDNDNLIQVNFPPKEIDVAEHGPYATYNWELFFHIPLTVAVHLTKTQRFAEAQRWFHYIFDPTNTIQLLILPSGFGNFWPFGRTRPASRLTICLLCSARSRQISRLTISSCVRTFSMAMRPSSASLSSRTR